MTRPITIALDVMGGDYGPSVTVPAALLCIAKHKDLHIALIGKTELIEPYLQGLAESHQQRLNIQHTEEVVDKNEKPSLALRRKLNSSMHIAVAMVKDNSADACVSAGNTGALMAIGRVMLRTLNGIDRPAIITTLPTAKGSCLLLDVGANVDNRAEHLFQFAVMGSVMATAIDNNDSPTVGLLNIGEEKIKGNEQVKLASQLMEQCQFLNYVGYVEGDELFQGNIDIVVCDGFVGNVTIKTSAGVAGVIRHALEQSFRSNWYAKLLGLLAQPVLQRLKNKIDPRRLNGASFLGLQGIVIKSHGNADVDSFSYAIDLALREIEKNVPKLINRQLAEILQ